MERFVLNVPRAERAPGEPSNTLEQMGTHSQQHKGHNSPFHHTKCKIQKKSLASGYLPHSTFTTPPPFSTCLDPPPRHEQGLSEHNADNPAQQSSPTPAEHPGQRTPAGMCCLAFLLLETELFLSKGCQSCCSVQPTLGVTAALQPGSAFLKNAD